MLGRLEKYLESKGYIRYSYKNKEWSIDTDNRPYYSTMGNLIYQFRKDNDTIEVGLFIHGKSPHLCAIYYDNELIYSITQEL